MDTDQKTCLDTVIAGHNLLLVGQAGTGKTYTIQKCVNQLRSMGKNVALTCYTGIACLQYQGLHPMTLHKFAGLEDGRHNNESLLHLVKSDEHFCDTKSRIMTTDVLIIDEISMVSKKIFESVEYLCRELRGNICFGGIQLILTGDFYQLPPIKDELYGDKGDYCFQALCFQQLFPHMFNLINAHRQSDYCLIKCINDLEKGMPSGETNSFLNSLSRPLSSEVQSQTVKLFARNVDVDLHNYRCLQTIDNPLTVFEAEDSGDYHYLNKMLAPKRLGIKDDSPVMLLRNVNERYVNGLTGRVLSIEPQSIKVTFKFEGKPETVDVTKYSFTKYDPVTNKCLARRYQFPLRLAYAITIHKSQGMTIPYVEIDCKHATNPGQIGVAVGRAESSEGLRVLNYNPSLCRKHNEHVNNFYANLHDIGDLSDTLDCCRVKLNKDPLPTVTEIYYSDSDMEESENLVNNLIHIDTETDENNNEGLDSFRCVEIDHSYTEGSNTTSESLINEHNYSADVCLEDPVMQTYFKKVMEDFIGTPQESVARNACDKILSNEAVTAWYTRQCDNINNIFETNCTTEPGNMNQKSFTQFYSNFNRYILSDEYTSQSESFTNIPFAHQILTSVMFVIQANILKKKAAKVEPKYPNDAIFPSDGSAVSDAGRGKVRYIGGYCIAKCRYRLCSNLRNSLFLPGMEKEINTMNKQIDFLDKMTVSYTDIYLSTVYGETLEETARKQNTCESLTNITDSVFEFFEILEITARSILTYETLVKKNKYMYRHILNEIMSSKVIAESFVMKCFKFETTADTGAAEAAFENVERVFEYINDTGISSVIFPIFERIVRLFVTVTVSQFRKDYLRVLKRQKGKALRKKVIEKKAVKDLECPSISSINKDCSIYKTVSHLKLKAIALQNEIFYNNFKKMELIQLLKSYGKDASMKSNKKQLGEALLETLKREDCVKMSCPHLFNEETQQSTHRDSSRSKVIQVEPVASTSGESRKFRNTHISPSIDITYNSETHPDDTLTKKSKTADEIKSTKGKQSVKKRKGKQVKGKGKRSKKCKNLDEADTTGDNCGMCYKLYRDGEDWICCDSCSSWYHRDCVGLDEEGWEYFSSPDAVFICPMCR